MTSKKRFLTISIIESILYVWILTQYLGSLGQYDIVLTSHTKWIWWNSYWFARVMLVVLIILQRTMKSDIYKIHKKSLVIFGYSIILFMISLMVSYTPGATLNYLLRLLLTIVIGIHFAQKYNLQKNIIMISVAQIIFLVMTLTFMIKYPEHAYFIDSAGDRVLLGMYTTKNPFAFELSFGILIFYLNMRMSQLSKRRFHIKNFNILIIVLQLYLLIQCQAVGSVITLIISIALTEYAVFFKKKLRLDCIYLLVNIGFFIVVLLMLPLLSKLLLALGRDVTLTGRTGIWASIIYFLQQNNLLFGFGYESFWSNEFLTNSLYLYYSANGVRYNYTGAHNTIIELLLYFGVVGLSIYGVLILNILKKAKFLKQEHKMFVYAYFVFFTIRGLVERSLSDTAYDTLLFAFMLTLIWQDYIESSQGYVRSLEPSIRIRRRSWKSRVLARKKIL